MNEQEYEARAIPELKQLTRALDELDATGLEVELAGDILTLEFDDRTRYVVNSHRAARQIWVAAGSAPGLRLRAETERWVPRTLGTRCGRRSSVCSRCGLVTDRLKLSEHQSLAEQPHACAVGRYARP